MIKTKKENEFDELTKSLGFILINTSMSIKDQLRKGFNEKGYDVTPDQFAVLIKLWNQDGLTQREICDKTHKNKSNLTRILDSMEKKELIIRQTNKEDRRSFSIFLTNKGKKIRAQLVAIAIDTNDKIFKDISSDDKISILRILDNVRKNIR